MTSPATLEAAAQDLAPAIGAAARKTHEQGIRCDALLTLNAAGLLRIYRSDAPSANAWGTHIGVTRILARSCATTAWIVTQTAEANRLIAAMGAAALVAAKPDAISVIADAAAPISVRRVGDQIILSGHWPHIAAASFADWLVLRGETDQGQMAFLVPTSSVTLIPADHRGGLRGCNFHSAAVNNLSVPVAQTFAIPADDAGLQTAAPLGAILGGAEGGYNDYVAMTRKRVSGTGGGAVSKLTQVQIRLAEADSDIAAARERILQITANLQSSTTPNATTIGRDSAVAARRCLQAITQLVQQMGALGLAEFNPVQRHYRDVRAMATDARVNWDKHMAKFGRQELGVPEPDALPAQAAE
ncbi:MAG: hypothetical protein JNM81_06665 [Rhodospirillaceae bacterium]|nr:hypothetical protein [Rhodospirillaceae bacterium]